MPHDDLAAITCYFNPEHYKTRLKNYKLFRDRLRYQDVPCLTIECVLEGDYPELEPGSDVVMVRARDSLWQKERLLNIAIDMVGEQYSKIAWLDCDVLFSDFNWADKSSALLDQQPIIQPWSRVAHLTAAGPEARAAVRYQTSFACINDTLPEVGKHGHCGFAWAARREVLVKHHLYDAGIIGHGDHLMAHAMHGDWETQCIKYHIPTPEAMDHFREWAIRFYEDVQGQAVSVKGEVRHLWHGEHRDRGYRSRHVPLRGFGFDPRVDIKINEHGTWSWATDKPALHAWVRNYFKKRFEDGKSPYYTGPQANYSSPRDPYPYPDPDPGSGYPGS